MSLPSLNKLRQQQLQRASAPRRTQHSAPAKARATPCAGGGAAGAAAVGGGADGGGAVVAVAVAVAEQAAVAAEDAVVRDQGGAGALQGRDRDAVRLGRRRLPRARQGPLRQAVKTELRAALLSWNVFTNAGPNEKALDEKLLGLADGDGDGEIDYAEFAAALAHAHKQRVALFGKTDDKSALAGHIAGGVANHRWGGGQVYLNENAPRGAELAEIKRQHRAAHPHPDFLEVPLPHTTTAATANEIKGDMHALKQRIATAQAAHQRLPRLRRRSVGPHHARRARGGDPALQPRHPGRARRADRRRVGHRRRRQDQTSVATPFQGGAIRRPLWPRRARRGQPAVVGRPAARRQRPPPPPPRGLQREAQAGAGPRRHARLSGVELDLEHVHVHTLRSRLKITRLVDVFGHRHRALPRPVVERRRRGEGVGLRGLRDRAHPDLVLDGVQRGGAAHRHLVLL